MVRKVELIIATKIVFLWLERSHTSSKFDDTVITYRYFQGPTLVLSK